MHFQKPLNLAVAVVAILGMLVALLAASAFLAGVNPKTISFFLFCSAALLAMAFGLIWYFTNRFVYNKIKVIYKNIHELKVGSEQEEDEIAETTDLKRVEREVSDWAEERSRELKNLREREAYRREFIGNVSHELKTPIFNIQGYLLTLLDGAMDEPEISTKYLKRAAKSVERMINIIQDLELITRLESGIMGIDMKPFDLLNVVHEAVDMIEDKARKRGIDIKIRKEPKQALLVVGDSKRIEQVLLNLLTNAIKYSKKEGGKVEIKFFDMAPNVLVEISDDGLGIPEKDLPRIFERFYRVDKSRARDAGGSGLGLAIVKHIIDVHKQSIHVRSTENVGSTFGFTLRLAKD